MNELKNKKILITGGTGSFGNYFIKRLLKETKCKQIIVYSRDEMKQWFMRNELADKRLKFVIGDVRDEKRLEEVTTEINILIHAAATKIVPTAEENPSECIHTNVTGAINVIRAAKKNKVNKVVALSTDKACNPTNIYGASKLASDKLFVSNNNLNSNLTKFSVVRYGNVINSRGSVIPFFKSFKNNQVIPITDPNMTRFILTLKDATNLVFLTLKNMYGGEIFVKKVPSVKITDIAKVVNKKCKTKIIGIRPGEKIHEEMISFNDARNTFEFKDYYKILPEIDNQKILKMMSKGGKKVKSDFSYESNTNLQWVQLDQLKKIIDDN